MKHFLALWIALFLPIAAQSYVPQAEQGDQNERPEEIENVGIDEKLNDYFPKGVVLNTESGKAVKVGDFYSSKKPVILSLVYFSCPSLCNLHLQGVFNVLQELGLTPGKDFEFLAVSIDPKEDGDLASAKKDTYLERYNLGEHSDGIHFLTGSEDQIKKLADTVGFKYKWNEKAQEWAHASAAIIATPEGQISRYLHGVYFDPNTFRLSVVEASQGKVGSFADNVALFCFRYDPKASKYAFYAVKMLRAAAFLVLVLLLIWLVPYWWRNRNSTVRG